MSRHFAFGKEQSRVTAQIEIAANSRAILSQMGVKKDLPVWSWKEQNMVHNVPTVNEMKSDQGWLPS